MEQSDPNNQNGNQGESGSQGGEGSENNGGSQQIDLTTIGGDQINKVLENAELWKNPRMKGLLEAEKQLKAQKEADAKKEEESLKEQNKFKELSEKKDQTISDLQSQLKNSTINQAITNKLAPLGVVSLDDALKLMDKSGISIDEAGNIQGVDTAVESLKNDKPYLFGTSNGKKPIGNGTNGNNGGGDKPTFKASQLRGAGGHKFYLEHQKEIDEAARDGRIEQD